MSEKKGHFADDWDYPHQFSCFDTTVLMDFESMLRILQKEHPGMEADEIRQYDENGLLPVCFLDNGDRGYPQYAVSRIGFIKELIEKWSYDSSKLKQITDYEEFIISHALAGDDFSYSHYGLPPLNLLSPT